jgi:glucose/arabinose dehydrogenase
LGQAGTLAACDSTAGADFTCTAEATTPTLTVALDGSTYARWTLAAPTVATPLTGDETLVMRAQQTGAVAPNLYLVENNGRRIAVPLARYGLREGATTVAVPLREIRDDEGIWPDFAAVNEIQVVFEWAAMAGTLTIDSLQFVAAWQETVALNPDWPTLAATLTVPDGFTATAIAGDLSAVTQLEFAAETLWASTQLGRVWRYRDADGDGYYEDRLLYAAGFEEVVGLLYDPTDGALWIGGRGNLYHTVDHDGNGVADQRELRLEGLPWGRHQNNGLAWNPDPDPFTGEPGNTWLYFGLGSTEDLEVGGEWNAQILRFPRTGQGQADLESVSRGNRNAYGVLWAPVPGDPSQPNGEQAWQLFASENGPDFNDAPDEVNHIRWQHDYGFPEQFGPVDEAAGAVDGAPYSGPVYPVTAHASANGLAYVTNAAWPAEYQTLYVSLFGQVFDPGIVGHTVERVTLTAVETADGLTYRGEPSTFVAGLDRPLPLLTAPNGDLVVGDYATGVVYQIGYTGGR